MNEVTEEHPKQPHTRKGKQDSPTSRCYSAAGGPERKS